MIQLKNTRPFLQDSVLRETRPRMQIDVTCRPRLRLCHVSPTLWPQILFRGQRRLPRAVEVLPVGILPTTYFLELCAPGNLLLDESETAGGAEKAVPLFLPHQDLPIGGDAQDAEGARLPGVSVPADLRPKRSDQSAQEVTREPDSIPFPSLPDTQGRCEYHRSCPSSRSRDLPSCRCPRSGPLR